jgi:hypothetical protein
VTVFVVAALLAISVRADAQAKNRRYTVEGTITVPADRGLLAGLDSAQATVVRHSEPMHGALVVNSDGSFTYTPHPDYRGKDRFTYAVSDGVQLYAMEVPPLGTIAGLTIRGDGYGSSLYPVPGASDEVFGLTDRGPNVYLPDGTLIEPLPNFQPSIGRFKLANGEARIEQTIPLSDAAGQPYSGRRNAQSLSGDRIVDLDGIAVPTDPNGYDPEGLVALPDGTFWVSDEYGPFIMHVDATGRQIGRLSPFDATLPRELANRVANHGMEGLTVTPDGSTLVGIMQSALQQPDGGATNPLDVAVVRIVTITLATGELHEYVYLLDNPAKRKTAISEIAALSNTTFAVDERDARFPPAAYKKLWRIDLAGATDVGPNSQVKGAIYDAERGGLLVDGRTLEALVGSQNTAKAADTLRKHGIKAVAKKLTLDVGGLLDRLDPQGRFFGHDKLEGVFVDPRRHRIILSNDSDFGVGGVTHDAPPFRLKPKRSPATGRPDDGEFLVIEPRRLSGRIQPATVTLDVVAAPGASPAAPSPTPGANR